LAQDGITLEEVRIRVAEIVGRGEGTGPGQMPFTPRGKKVLELSLSEALSLGHEFIGSEHILLGLLREGQGVANHVLDEFGASAERTRSALLALLEGDRPPDKPADPLAAFEPPSPPFAPEFVQELRRLRARVRPGVRARETGTRSRPQPQAACEATPASVGGSRRA
jgi:ATP-dependent Clp protease ATP-binding subunit ClpA